MKVVSINLGNAGSTGSIARNIKHYAALHGIEVFTAYPASEGAMPREENDIIIGKDFFRRISRTLAVYTGLNGCFAFFATYKLLRTLKSINPEIIHLHNLHHSYINLPMLFSFIRKSKIKTIWTLHDCWAFTGQCAHFTMAKCDKWKNGCYECPQLHFYPEAKNDQTKLMWKLKRKWFSGIDNLKLITPSKWLADLVRLSFLHEYDIQVINNGIDNTVFKPIKSDLRDKLNCSEKVIVLGVAFGWGEKKGYDVFLKLANDLPEIYQIIIVGKIGSHPKDERIIYIDRTRDQRELAMLYTIADMFVNTTREENFPTVNIEALSCGTPVITFRTGGSPEIVDESTGIVVDCDDYDGLKKAIFHVGQDRPFSETDCIKRAGLFTISRMLNKYIEVYNQL